MPRADLPKLAARPTITPFKLTRADRRNIARSIRVNQLPSTVIELIEWNVACYRAVKSGANTCTVANTLFALRQLEKKGRGRREALDLLANDRAAVDYTTLDAIQNLAKAVLAEQPRAGEKLRTAAQQRIAELPQHPRILPASEPLRFFCGVLREIFKVATVHLNDPIAPEKAWHLCRRFALAVFDAANIERVHFFEHPARLTEYLQTDVATG